MEQIAYAPVIRIFFEQRAKLDPPLLEHCRFDGDGFIVHNYLRYSDTTSFGCNKSYSSHSQCVIAQRHKNAETIPGVTSPVALPSSSDHASRLRHAAMLGGSRRPP